MKRIRNSGIEVVVGVLEEQCKLHHRKFFTFQEKKRPYIILKWAQTLDGFLAPLQKNKQEPFWISNEYSRQITHKLRAQEHSILVGTNTVLEDNPKLNIRSWFGENPTRIVIDKELKLSHELSVFNDASKTIIITKDRNVKNKINDDNLYYEEINFQNSIANQICTILHKHNIQSLTVEGGLKTLQTFIDENLWDEAYVFEGNSFLEKGISSPNFQAKLFSKELIFDDTLKKYIND